MVVNRVGGPKIGETVDVIEPPNDMHLPLMRPAEAEAVVVAAAPRLRLPQKRWSAALGPA